MRAWFFILLLPAAFEIAFAEVPKQRKTESHGKGQLNRMLSDIPQMGKDPFTGEKLAAGDPFFESVAVLFSGKASGVPVFWDSALPQGPEDANHTTPRAKELATIRIRRRDRVTLEEYSFDYLWSLALYELHNVQEWEAFSELSIQAWLGRVSRDDYVREVVRVEYGALKALEDFYHDSWVPFCERIDVPANPYLWLRTGELSFEDWFAALPEDGYYLPGYRANYASMRLKGMKFLRVFTEEEWEFFLRQNFDPWAPGSVLQAEAARLRRERLRDQVIRTVGE